jgi:5-carboxymethyl-2-hydroxymuconate isomerase
MPHCILEYTDNIPNPPDTRSLLTKLHNAMTVTELFDPADIKSRVIVHRDYLIGDGAPSRAFVTLNISILTSRPVKIKEQLADLAIEVLKEAFSDCIEGLTYSLTVQISELDRECYRRSINYGPPMA